MISNRCQLIKESESEIRSIYVQINTSFEGYTDADQSIVVI